MNISFCLSLIRKQIRFWPVTPVIQITPHVSGVEQQCAFFFPPCTKQSLKLFQISAPGTVPMQPLSFLLSRLLLPLLFFPSSSSPPLPPAGRCLSEGKAESLVYGNGASSSVFITVTGLRHPQSHLKPPFKTPLIFSAAPSVWAVTAYSFNSSWFYLLIHLWK